MLSRFASRIVLCATIGLAARAEAAPKVLICMADANGGGTDLQTKLKNSMAFATVDVIDCEKSTPTLQVLKMYEAVFSYSDTMYSDRALLGSNLADYVDAGGGVVLAQFALSSGFQIELQGRWAQDNYNCITPGKILYQNSTLKQAPNDPNHLIVQGVTSVTSQYRASAGVNMAKGAKSLWDFADGSPGVCHMAFNGHQRVDLNFYPGPPPQFYQEGKPGDGALLIKNSLLYVSGGFNPLKGLPSPTVFPDTGTGAVSNPITITYTNTSMMQQTVNTAVIGGAHAGDFLLVKAPQLPLAVASMATVSVDVVFQPNVAGARTATLQLGVANQMSTADVTLSGNAIPSSVKITPFPIAMGGTQMGMPIMKDITVSNIGQGKVTILDMKVTMGQGVYTLSNAPGFPVALIGGGGFPVTVTFAPQMNGITNGILTLTSDDPNTPTLHVPMSGYAGPPAITLDSGSIAFGNVNLGATTPQPVIITNSGFSNLTVTDIQVAGNDPGDFPVDKKMAVGVIGAQQSQPFVISFKPTQLGQRSATVTVLSSAGNKTIAVFGQGTSATLSVAPKMLAFAPVHVLKTSPAQKVTLSNAGNGTLKIMSLAFGGKDGASFKQAGGPMLPFSVGPNASVPVDVVCTPQIFGPLAATLTVVSDVGSQDVTLTGEGTAPQIAVSPTSIDFGQVPVQNASLAQAVTITNKGTDALTVSLLTIAGPDNGDFVSKDQPVLPLVLQPNGTFTFHVTFSPSQNANETAQIEILCDDPLMQQVKIPMIGTGIQAGVSVAPMTVDFGPTMIGTVGGPKPVTLTNTGDLAIAIDTVTLGGAGQALFTVDMKGPFTIEKGQKATLMVSYSPLSAGPSTATLTIAAANLVPIVINLRGSGISPSIAVSPIALDFGPIEVGTTSAPQTVGLKNGGTTPLTLESIKSGDNVFTVDTTNTTLMLGPGGTTTFTVTFTPAEPKTYSAKLGVTLKGHTMPILHVTASGSGATDQPRPMGGCSAADTRRPGGSPLLLGVLFALFTLRKFRNRYNTLPRE